MAGKVKQLIDTIIAQRSKGNPSIAKVVKAKFALKGINPDEYGATSADDPAVIGKLQAMARELGVNV
jgi:hypothetical protein